MSSFILPFFNSLNELDINNLPKIKRYTHTHSSHLNYTHLAFSSQIMFFSTTTIDNTISTTITWIFQDALQHHLIYYCYNNHYYYCFVYYELVLYFVHLVVFQDIDNYVYMQDNPLRY